MSQNKLILHNNNAKIEVNKVNNHYFDQNFLLNVNENNDTKLN